MGNLSSNKKILISVGAFAAVVLILVGVLCILGAKGDSTPPEEEKTSGKNNSYQVSESFSSGEVTTSPVMNDGSYNFNASELEIIQAYVSGTYYLRGEIDSDDMLSDIDIAMSDTNFHTTMEVEGMDMGIMYLGGKVYFTNGKKYLDFNSLAAMLGGELDFDMSELDEISKVMDMTQYDFEDVIKKDSELDGTPAVCYRYYNNEVELCFWFIDGSLVKIELSTIEGDILNSIKVLAFSPTIPSDMLSLSSYTPATIFDFFGEDLMNELMADEDYAAFFQ